MKTALLERGASLSYHSCPVRCLQIDLTALLVSNNTMYNPSVFTYITGCAVAPALC